MLPVKKLSTGFGLGKTASAPTVGVIVATNNNSSSQRNDQLYVTNLQSALSRVSGVQGVRSGGISSDGQAEEFDVVVSSSVNTDPTSIIKSIRTAMDKITIPSNAQEHLAGELADAVDNSKKSGSTNSQDTTRGGYIYRHIAVARLQSTTCPTDYSDTTVICCYAFRSGYC